MKKMNKPKKKLSKKKRNQNKKRKQIMQKRRLINFSLSPMAKVQNGRTLHSSHF